MANEQDVQQGEQEQQEGLHELLQVRHDKMNQLREWGYDPFGKKFEQTHHADEIVKAYGE
ncbi:lysine--tRNA ligase, partial [Brevibacillus invocatus]